MLRLGDGEGLIVPHTHLRGASFPRPKMRTGMVKEGAASARLGVGDDTG
jgi:hypothetical protein